MINLEKLRIPFLILIGAIVIFVVGFNFGSIHKEEEILDRFEAVPNAPCYDEGEVIKIIFGEYQLL